MSNPTYSAHISPDENGAPTMIVRRAIPGGIDGPFSPAMPVEGLSLAQIEDELNSHGYALAESWTTVKAYDGLRLSAELIRL